MGNKNPKLENLKSFKRASDRELGRVVGTRYPLDVAEALGKVGDHQGYIRNAVEQKLKADGLLPEVEQLLKSPTDNQQGEGE